MKATTSIIILAILSSCTVEPFTYKDKAGREIASLGGSMLTKSKDQERIIKRPNGEILYTRTVGKNEVGIPTNKVIGELAGQGVQELGAAANTALKR